jgi:hypothetical protein
MRQVTCFRYGLGCSILFLAIASTIQGQRPAGLTLFEGGGSSWAMGKRRLKIPRSLSRTATSAASAARGNFKLRRAQHALT